MRRFLFALCGLGILAIPAQAQHFALTVHILGFTDFNYIVTDRNDLRSGFRSGQWAGHLSAELTDRLSFFTEITATPTSSNFNVEIERAFLRYDFNDYFRLSAGRFHTPISYWNVTYHHGQWLQTTANRPEMIKFGGRYIPTHFIGVQADGSLAQSSLGLSYFAGVGNGRDSSIARGGDAGDRNSQRAWTAGMELTPPALEHLKVGGGVYVDRIGTDASPQIKERMFGAHLVWDSEQPEIISEMNWSRHEAASGATETSKAGYVQVAYRLPGSASSWKPYFRYERDKIPVTDPLLGTLTPAASLDYRGWTAGLRYDFAPVAALKGEWRRERFAGTTVEHDTIVFQVSLTYPGFREGEAMP